MSVLGRFALTIGAVALITSCGGTQNGPTGEPPPGSGLGKVTFHATSGDIRCVGQTDFKTCIFHAAGQANGDDGVFHNSFRAQGDWIWHPTKDTWSLNEKIFVDGFSVHGVPRTITGFVQANGKDWASHIKPGKLTADHLNLSFNPPADEYMGDNGSIIMEYNDKQQLTRYDSEFDMHP